MALSFLKRQAGRPCLCAALAGWPRSLAQDLFAPRLYRQRPGDHRISRSTSGSMFLQAAARARRPRGRGAEGADRGPPAADRGRAARADASPRKRCKQGMEEFASRANLTAEQLDRRTGQGRHRRRNLPRFRGGRACLAQGRCGRASPARSRSRKPISTRRWTAATRPGALQVLVSELVIPVPEGEDGAAALALAQPSCPNDIAAKAPLPPPRRQYSAAPTAGSGGRLDWMPLSNLPAAIGGPCWRLARRSVRPAVSAGRGGAVPAARRGRRRSAAPVAVSVE